jgi:hypothetical protein
MTDPVTGRQLRVSTDGTAGPYVVVPPALMSDVTSLLVANNIPYAISADAVRTDSTTVYNVLSLDTDCDATAVQNILDSVRD